MSTDTGPYRTAAGVTAVVLAILLGRWLVVLLRTLVVVLLVAAILTLPWTGR